MFMVYILGQDSNEIVAMATVLCQSLLQWGRRIGRWLQPDNIVGNRESQFDSLDQDLTRTFRKRARQGNREENSVINNQLKTSTKYLEEKTSHEHKFTCWAVQPGPRLWYPLPLP